MDVCPQWAWGVFSIFCSLCCFSLEFVVESKGS